VKTHVKNYSQVGMLPLETKRSWGKLLPHSDLRGGGGVVFLEVSRSRQRKRDIVLGKWNVRSLYRAGSLTDPDVDERIILIWIFRKWEGVVGTGWSWLRIGTCGWHL
jgi:hypothetical protein